MIRRSQRQSKFNLVRAFDLMVAPSGRPGGDDDEDDTEDDSDGEDTGDGDDTDTGGDGDGKKVDNPEAKKHADDAAKHRNRAKQLQAELDELAAWRKEHEDKGKERVEILERDLKDTQEKLKTSEAKTKSQAVELAFFKSGASASFHDPATALQLMSKDLKDVELDDEGDADPEAIRKLADDLGKQKPYLLRKEGEDSGNDDNTDQPSGRPTNKKKKKGDADREVLVKKFPALQGR